VNRVDVAWSIGNPVMGGSAALMTRLRVYGKDRVPRTGGLVVAYNHLSWIDIPAFGWSSPRTIYFLAKAEAHAIPLVGAYLRLFGSFGVRRGESDREAVRRMRDVVRAGNALGIFAEGTRQRSGKLGPVQPGAAMAALQEKRARRLRRDLRLARVEAGQLQAGLDRVRRADALHGPAAERQGLPRGVRRDPGGAAAALGVAARPARGRQAEASRPAARAGAPPRARDASVTLA